MKSTKTSILLLTLAVALVATGCATKKYVGKEVGAVNQKVETLSDSVEQNQELSLKVIEPDGIVRAVCNFCSSLCLSTCQCRCPWLIGNRDRESRAKRVQVDL